MNIHIVVYVLIISFLAGCQSQQVRDVTSPYFSPPAGSRLTLHKEIIIPPEQAHIYVQFGRLHTVNTTNLYYPNCKLKMKDISADSQVIKPGSFQVIKTTSYTNIFMLTELGRVQVAGLFTDASGDGDLGDIMYVTDLQLRSTEQPHVDRILCQQLDDPGLGEHVTVSEIMKTLGEIATLELAKAE